MDEKDGLSYLTAALADCASRIFFTRSCTALISRCCLSIILLQLAGSASLSASL